MTLTEQLIRIRDTIYDLEELKGEVYKYLNNHIEEGTIYDININTEDLVIEINQKIKFDNETLNKIFYINNPQTEKYKLNETYYIPLQAIIMKLQVVLKEEK